MGNHDITTRVNGCDSMQPLVVLIGTSLQFSDQTLRVLRLEFAGVRFTRVGNPLDVIELEQRPNVVIVHEAVPDLNSKRRLRPIDIAGSALAGERRASF